MNYDQYVEYLKNKYGAVPKHYFSRNGIPVKSNKRITEGLFIHHIDEDKVMGLSAIHNDKFKRRIVEEYTYDQLDKIYGKFQQPDRLVYCNLLEHAKLHSLIKVNQAWVPNEMHGKIGLFKYLLPKLNRIISDPWHDPQISKVINIEEYWDFIKELTNQAELDILIVGASPSLALKIKEVYEKGGNDAKR